MPAARVTRIQRKSTVDQGYHGADVLAKEAQRERGICYDDRVIRGHLQRSPRKRGAFETVTLAIFDGAKEAESVMANRRPGERGPIVRVALNSLFK